jgi:hypothetical protein
VAWGVTDFIHDCNSGNATLDNEDVLVLGHWNDYTGSDFTLQSETDLKRGITNSLAGTRAAIEGGFNEPRTSRGNPTSRFRTRQHKEFIEVKDVGHK